MPIEPHRCFLRAVTLLALAVIPGFLTPAGADTLDIVGKQLTSSAAHETTLTPGTDGTRDLAAHGAAPVEAPATVDSAGAAQGSWLAKAQRSIERREYWASRNRQGLQAGVRRRGARTMRPARPVCRARPGERRRAR